MPTIDKFTEDFWEFLETLSEDEAEELAQKDDFQADILPLADGTWVLLADKGGTRYDTKEDCLRAAIGGAFRTDAPRLRRFGKLSFKIRGKKLPPQLVLRGAGGRFAGSLKRGGITAKPPRSSSGNAFHGEILNQARRVNRKNPRELIGLGKRFSDRHLPTGAKDKEFQNLFADITNYQGVSTAQRKARIAQIDFDPNISTSRKRILAKRLEKLLGLSGNRGAPNQIESINPQIFSDIPKKRINIGYEFNQRDLFYEGGRLLEVDDPDLAIASQKWRQSRATGSTKKLSEITGNSRYGDEEALPGSFVDPFVGKLHSPDDHTEVLAVGLERFTDPRKMRELYQADPEHFHLVVGGLLSGKVAPAPAIPVTTPRTPLPKTPATPSVQPIPQSEISQPSLRSPAINAPPPITIQSEQNLVKNLNLNTTLTAGGITVGGVGAIAGARRFTIKERKKKKHR